MPFIGKQGSTGNSKIKKYSFTADASQRAFSVNSDASDELQVFLNGVLLKETDDYTYTTSTVTLGTGASVNDIVEVHVYQSFLIADAVRETGDTMTGELVVPTVKLSSNVIKASDGGSTITLDTSDNVTLAGNLVIPDGGNIGSASDTDAIAIASDGGLTFSGGIDNAGTISAGTIGSGVSFPVGLIEGRTVIKYAFGTNGSYIVDGTTERVTTRKNGNDTSVESISVNAGYTYTYSFQFWMEAWRNLGGDTQNRTATVRLYEESTGGGTVTRIIGDTSVGTKLAQGVMGRLMYGASGSSNTSFIFATIAGSSYHSSDDTVYVYLTTNPPLADHRNGIQFNPTYPMYLTITKIKGNVLTTRSS